MRTTLVNAGCILCLVVAINFHPIVGNVEDEGISPPMNNAIQEAEPNVPNMRPLDGMKRARMRNMLEQHALRLKRGGYNSGFAHALRVRRGGIDERSSWGHALRVRSSNMLNRGHALRIKRKPGDYRSFALRVRKDDSSMRDLLDKSLEDQEYSDDYSEPQVLNAPSDELNEGVGQVTDPRDLYDNYYGNNYLKSWAFPARRLRSASFAHVLRV
jgi:muconolactone delta-isomerase